MSAHSGRRTQFTCPICSYVGPFAEIHAGTGLRRHAMCPGCGAKERHRLQYMVLARLAKAHDFSTMSLIHFAPEPFFAAHLPRLFGRYHTADLGRSDVDIRVDLRCLPFRDASYDFVFASHVLEHVREDEAALSEISRVMRPGGVTLLHVPILGETTVEYAEPNPHESNHVRAPGIDYYDRLEPHFERVDRFDSGGFPPECQPFIYENRARWPEGMPDRLTTPGERHADIVAVCWK